MALSARNKAMLPGVIFITLGVIVVMRFGALILFLTIIPSIVAFFVDRANGRPSFRVIAACNVASALPYIVQIIDFSLKGYYGEVGKVIDSPVIWARIYCGPAAGWAMLYLAKFVARIITLMHYEYAMGVLEKKQTILLNEWGEEIIPAPSAKARNNQ